ncbi:MAG: DUF4397 domain-containing protein [Bryobacteraceae bacterium]
MRQLLFGGLFSAALWTAGCTSGLTTDPSVTTSSDSATTKAPAGTTAAQDGNALVRLVNADPGGKGIDISWGDKNFFSDAAYKSITAYKEAPRGVAMFQLRVAGNPENVSGDHQELLPGRHYTLIALPKEKRGSRLSVLIDNLGALDPGITRVRLINATANVDDLDMFSEGTKNHIVHGVDAGAKVVMSYADMEGGTVEIRSPNGPSPTLVGKFNVDANCLHTFIVVGAVGSLDVIQVVDRIR